MKSLTKSISGLDTLVSGGMNLNPTITPVIDLTGVKKDAARLGNMLAVKPLTVQAAYSQAKDASVGYSNNQNARAMSDAASNTTDVTFIQNNNSPKALSRAEIYRQTNNQLSRVKGAVNK